MKQIKSRDKVTIVNLKGISTLLVFLLLMHQLLAQQRRWMLPETSNSTQVPMIDFTSGTPVFYSQALADNFTTQSVGNGEYCNACSNNPNLVSEFFISGAQSDFYNTSGTLRAVRMTWDQICGPAGIQETFSVDECNPSNDLVHESLAEVALGDGEVSGSFFAVMQRSQTATSGNNGLGVYVYLLDANNSALCGNQIVDLGPIIDAAVGSPITNYNEGVALGPRFVYHTVAGDTPALIALDGNWCRSVYVASQNGMVYHLIIDLSTFDLNDPNYLANAIVYSDAINTNNGNFIELDLSFPQGNGIHPIYLATGGWNGINVIDLNGNGRMTAQSEINTNICVYLEFDMDDNYLYYSQSRNSNSIILHRYDLNANTTAQWPAVQSFSSIAGWNYLTLETASDGRIHMINNANNGMYTINNPSTAGATLSAPIILNPQYLPVVFTTFHNMPDWVDGETPLESGGATIEICVESFGCGDAGPVPVDVSIGPNLIHHFDINPGDCEELNVCPGATYTVNFDNGGQIDSSFVLNANDDKLFTYSATPFVASSLNYTTNTTISTDVYWDGKVSLANNVIVTVDSDATLDISNVDVLFGECAGIVISDGATLRANNAVFRPCDPTSVWRGIEFLSTAALQADIPMGWFNECTFKNAKHAIYFNGNNPELQTRVKVTNNLFSNCQIGVGGRNATLSESITGNTFYFDDNIPEYTAWNCNNWVTNNRRTGILSDNINYKGEISQNDFIYSDEVTQGWNFTHGIDMGQFREVNISDNQFTNMEQAIEIRNAEGGSIRIERNNITVSSTIRDIEPQIKLVEVAGAELYGNQLLNTNFSNQAMASLIQSGIYGSNSASILIRENVVTGFETAIQLESVSDAFVIDNTVNDSWYYGVYANNCQSILVSCNEIDMDVTSTRSTVGIAFYQTFNNNANNQVRNNCVFESASAIYTNATSTGLNAVLPIIENNFLYNYIGFGLENVNFFGNLGTANTPSTLAGKNTFTSNNTTALDVSSNTAMTVFGCWGIANISANVTLSGGNFFNSTASCGLQITTQLNQITSEEICDDTDFSVGGARMKPSQKGNADNETTKPVKEPTHYDNGLIRLGSTAYVNVFPNPVEDVLNLQWHELDENSELVILNALGVKVRSIVVSNETSTMSIEVSDLADGIYFINAVDKEQKQLVKKFIK